MVADQAQRGQVISYHSFSKPREIISHRVVAIQPNGAIITKGDNRPDNDLPVPAPAVIGKVVAVAPGMGNLMRWLKSGYGLTLLYVAASCLLSINIGRFLAKSGQAYELHGR